MDYAQTLNFIFTKLPMFSRIGAAAYKKDLTNIITLCEALGNPQNEFKTIHVAGTNGKGSVCHSIAAILQTAGYKTGLHTSPHLKDFRERIKINGLMCSENFVISFIQKINPLIDVIEPSFFEISVAMAFEYFALEKVDVAVIETGLGGRLDSTNIINPIISIITNIGYDHMNMLGNTLPEIAFEKAGIIKQNTPVIIGEVLQETKSVFEKISIERNANISYAQNQYFVSGVEQKDNKLKVDLINTNVNKEETYILDLPGIYQVKNLITTLTAIRELQKLGFDLNNNNVHQAMQNIIKIAGLHGRWEKIHDNPSVILDVAHNVDGIKQLVAQVELCQYRQLYIITGMVRDKEVEKVLSLMPKKAIYYFTQANIPRALSAWELAEKAANAGIPGEVINNVNEALNKVLSIANKEDMILICGSIFLVGEVKY